MFIFEDSLSFFGGGEDGEFQLKFYHDFNYDLKNHRWGFVAAVGFLANQFQMNKHHPHNIHANFTKERF